MNTREVSCRRNVQADYHNSATQTAESGGCITRSKTTQHLPLQTSGDLKKNIPVSSNLSQNKETGESTFQKNQMENVEDNTLKRSASKTKMPDNCGEGKHPRMSYEVVQHVESPSTSTAISILDNSDVKATNKKESLPITHSSCPSDSMYITPPSSSNVKKSIASCSEEQAEKDREFSKQLYLEKCAKKRESKRLEKMKSETAVVVQTVADDMSKSDYVFNTIKHCQQNKGKSRHHQNLRRDSPMIATNFSESDAELSFDSEEQVLQSLGYADQCVLEMSIGDSTTELEAAAANTSENSVTNGIVKSSVGEKTKKVQKTKQNKKIIKKSLEAPTKSITNLLCLDSSSHDNKATPSKKNRKRSDIDVNLSSTVQDAVKSSGGSSTSSKYFSPEGQGSEYDTHNIRLNKLPVLPICNKVTKIQSQQISANMKSDKVQDKLFDHNTSKQARKRNRKKKNKISKLSLKKNNVEKSTTHVNENEEMGTTVETKYHDEDADCELSTDKVSSPEKENSPQKINIAHSDMQSIHEIKTEVSSLDNVDQSDTAVMQTSCSSDDPVASGLTQFENLNDTDNIADTTTVKSLQSPTQRPRTRMQTRKNSTSVNQSPTEQPPKQNYTTKVYYGSKKSPSQIFNDESMKTQTKPRTRKGVAKSSQPSETFKIPKDLDVPLAFQKFIAMKATVEEKQVLVNQLIAFYAELNLNLTKASELEEKITNFWGPTSEIINLHDEIRSHILWFEDCKTFNYEPIKVKIHSAVESLKNVQSLLDMREPVIEANEVTVPSNETTEKIDVLDFGKLLTESEDLKKISTISMKIVAINYQVHQHIVESMWANMLLSICKLDLLSINPVGKVEQEVKERSLSLCDNIFKTIINQKSAPLNPDTLLAKSQIKTVAMTALDLYSQVKAGVDSLALSQGQMRFLETSVIECQTKLDKIQVADGGAREARRTVLFLCNQALSLLKSVKNN